MGNVTAGKILAFFNKLSIFQKMIISFMIVIVLPALLSFMISSRTAENLITAQTLSDRISSVEVALSSISGVVNELSHASIYLCNDDQIQELLLDLNKNTGELDGAAQANRLQLLRKAGNIVTNVFYTNRIDAYITLMSKYGAIGYTNYSINHDDIRAYLSRYSHNYLKQLGGRVVFAGIDSNYFKNSLETSTHVISWVKTVENEKDGSLIGALIVSVPEKVIAGLMVSESIPEKRIILDREMKVIASSEKQWLTESFSALCGRSLPLNEKGHVNYDINGMGQSILSYKRMEISGWTLIDIKPVSELYGRLHEVSASFLLLNLASILIFLIIAAGIARGISVPLHRLSVTMLETDLSIASEPVPESGRDEVRVLERNFIIMKRNINLLMKENIETEKKKREAEFQALQSQISPHFLFNTLNTARCAIETDKKEKASEIILALINLLKMTLHKGEALITLEQEVDMLKNYVKILQMRHSLSFKAYFDIPDILKDYRVPRLLLQPLIENSILHGIKDLGYEGIIQVSGDLEEDKVILRISDNGKGLSEDPLEDSKARRKNLFSGIGVKNVNERIKLHYGNQYGLRYTGAPGTGTVAEIILPWLEEETIDDDKNCDC